MKPRQVVMPLYLPTRLIKLLLGLYVIGFAALGVLFLMGLR